MTQATVNISMPQDPPARAAALGDDADVAVVFTPHRHLCDVCVSKALVACMITNALGAPPEGGCAGYRGVIIAPSVSSLRRWVTRVFGNVGEFKGNVFNTESGGEVHFVNASSAGDLDVEAAHDVLIDQADQVEKDCYDVARSVTRRERGRVRVVAQAVASRHWLSRLAEAPGVSSHRVDWTVARDGGTLLEEPTPEELKDRNAWFAEPPSETYRLPSLRRWAQDRLWVRTKQGKIVRYALTDLQHRYTAAKRRARMIAHSRGQPQTQVLVLKARRLGVSTIEQAQSYQQCVTVPETRVITLAQTDKDTRTIFEIAQRFHKEDPEAPPIKGAGNETRLVFPRLNSQYTCVTAGAHAPKRGDTLSRVHGSEVAHWCSKNAATVDNLISGLTDACSHGEIVLETTPNGMEWFASKWKDSEQGLNDWHRIFLAWFMDPTNRLAVNDEQKKEILDTLQDDEANLMARENLDIEQIAWRRYMKRKHRILFPQEHPEDPVDCFLSTGLHFVDQQVVRKRLAEIGDDTALRKKIREVGANQVEGGMGYSIEWSPPRPGFKYCCGCDTSEGIPGCDPNGFSIIEKDTGRDVFAVHGCFKPKTLAKLVVQACTRYNNAFLGIERENHGHAVLQAVIDLKYRMPYVLFHFKDGRPGWSTNEETRPKMLEDFSIFLEESPGNIMDRTVLQEAQTFKLQPDGKFAADVGAHDDAFMKRAIAHAMRRYRQGSPNVSTMTVEEIEAELEAEREAAGA